jgi:hypothetical protein
MTTTYIKPNFLLSRVANPVLRRWDRVPALVVRGRSSGRELTVPLGKPLEVDGRGYLVSGRGETHWVRNLRAAGQGAFRIHGRRTPFRATELYGRDRARIVTAYRTKLGKGVEPYFQQIPDPAAHAVFRMDPIAPAPVPVSRSWERARRI